MPPRREPNADAANAAEIARLNREVAELKEQVQEQGDKLVAQDGSIQALNKKFDDFIAGQKRKVRFSAIHHRALPARIPFLSTPHGI